MRAGELKPMMGAVTLRFNQAKLTWLIGHPRLRAISLTLDIIPSKFCSPLSYIDPLALNTARFEHAFSVGSRASFPDANGAHCRRNY